LVGLIHRLVAVLVCFGLIAGHAAVCAGWAATPEERMACCADGGNCPMHKGESHDSASGNVLTQAEADSCCASSEGEDSSPSTPTFVAAISLALPGPGIVLPVSVPALVLSDGWRTVSPSPAPPVPKHLLLSVFLV
jgi:hypothetical protein